MQLRRISVLEFLLLVAIIGLCCTIPVQCYRAVRESDYQAAAEYHADCGDRLASMADHPAAWMTEFRPQLRRLASWEHWQSQRLNKLLAHEDAAEERLANEVLSAADRQRFWLRFNSVAALNGYEAPPLQRLNRHERRGAIIERCVPTALVIGLLSLLLFGSRLRRRRAQTTNRFGAHQAWQTWCAL
jgi:hypothetical protein